MPNVRMPNGTIIQNVPKGTSKADLLAKLQRGGYDTQALLRPPVVEGAQAPEAEEPQEELGFFGALKRGFDMVMVTSDVSCLVAGVKMEMADLKAKSA